MDNKTSPTVQNAPLHQQSPDSNLHRQPTTEAQPGSEFDAKPASLTKANMRAFNRASDVKESRRRGDAIPGGEIDLEVCSSTSSERYRKQREQIMQYMTPSNDERVAAVRKHFEDYDEAHREEWECQRKEKGDRVNKERQLQRKVAVDAALERVRKVPFDQAPSFRERAELDWAEEEAWWLRELELFEAEKQAAMQLGPDASETLPPAVPSESKLQEKGGNNVVTTVEGNGQDRGHESTAAGAPHVDGGVNTSGWENDPSFIALRDPNFEPWVVKQMRLQEEREQREKEQSERWQRQQTQKEQKQKDQGQGEQDQGQHFVPLRRHEDPATPADHLRSLLPANFPRYRNIHGMNDMGAYLANASYAVSLGGPPSADLKYGIIVVPVGEEGTLFGKQPSDVMTPEFIQEVYDSRYTRHLAAEKDFHEAAHDSAEFLRPRFASVPSIDRSWHSLEGVVDPAAPAGPDGSHDMHEKVKATSQPTGLDGAPPFKDTASEPVHRD